MWVCDGYSKSIFGREVFLQGKVVSGSDIPVRVPVAFPRVQVSTRDYEVVDTNIEPLGDGWGYRTTS